MAIWGYNTIGASNQASAAGQKWAWKWQCPSDCAFLDEFWVYMDKTVATGGAALYGCLYTDDGGTPGSPVNVVANSSIQLSTNLTQNSPQWYHAAYGTKPAVTPGTWYWFCILTAVAERNYYDAVSAGTLQQALNSTVPDTYPFDDPFPVVDSRSSQRMASCYMVYTPVVVKTGTATITGTATVPNAARVKIKKTTATISGSATVGSGPIPADSLISLQQTRNLNWFYKPPSNNSTADVMKCDHCILTKGDETFLTSLRQAGYLEPILQYVRGEAIQDSPSPQQNQVAWNAGDFADIDANHPDWFMLDKNGNRILASQAQGDKWMMEPSSVGWQNYFINKMKSNLALGQFNGVFMDNQELSLAKRESEGNFLPAIYMTGTGLTDAYGNAYNQTASDTLYRAGVKSFLTAVKKGLPGIVMGNLINQRPEASWAEYLTILDGGMHEATYVDWHTAYLSSAAWVLDLALIVANKNLLFVAQADDVNDLTRAKFCYCSYLLITQPNYSFRYAAPSANYTGLDYYSFMDIDLGAPTGAYTGPAAGVYTRQFKKGYVTVNPTSHASAIVAYKLGVGNPLSGTATVPNATARRIKSGTISVPVSGTATSTATGGKQVGGAGAASISGSATTSAIARVIRTRTGALSGTAITLALTAKVKLATATIAGDCSIPGVIWWKYATRTGSCGGDSVVLPMVASKVIQAVFGVITGDAVTIGRGIRRQVLRGGSTSGSSQTSGNGVRTRSYATGTLEPKLNCRH